MHSPERQNAESPATGAHTDGTFGIYELRWQVIYTKKCLYTAQVVAVAVVPKNGHRATISLAHIVMGCTLLVRFIHSLELRCFEYSSRRLHKCEYSTIENSLISVLVIVSAAWNTLLKYILFYSIKQNSLSFFVGSIFFFLNIIDSNYFRLQF